MSKNKWVKLGSWLKNSVWVFPVFLLVIFALFIFFRITGTSAGIYYQRLYGNQVKDPNLIYGHPKAIRSDEWLVGTQRIISQSRNNYSRTNPDMVSGQQVSLKEDLPVKYWTTVFRPQNWGYLVLPFQNAFAFKWWLPMLVLMTGCYFFTLRLFPGKKLFASLISLAVGLSPFELWWYQTGAFITVGMGLFMALLVMRLLDGDPLFFKDRRRGLAVQVILFAFALSCFGLIFYPPFQIPVAMGLLFFSLGYFLQKRYNGHLSWSTLLKRSSLIICGTLIAVVVGGLFIFSHRQVLSIINDSVYPGHRIVTGGTPKPLSFFNSFVMPLEQSDSRAAQFVGNQSESSNFILLLPFLILPAFVLMFMDWRYKKRVDWILVGLQFVALLLYIRVFTTLGQLFFRLFFLERVPDKRLLIGLGFVGIIQMLYVLKKIRQAKVPADKLERWALGYGFACFLVLMTLGRYITHVHPKFIHNMLVITGLSLAFSAIITALLLGRMIWFASLFLLFTLASSFRIMPLYRGLDILTDNQVVHKIESASKPGDSWASVGSDAGIYENFALLAGRKSISGVQFYSDRQFWSQVGGNQYDYAYNRQGHAFFTDDTSMKKPIDLLSSDSFIIKFQCSPFILKNVNFALSVHPLNLPCVKQIDTVKYPATTFYFYKVTK